jgi:hypothetical protein
MILRASKVDIFDVGARLCSFSTSTLLGSLSFFIVEKCFCHDGFAIPHGTNTSCPVVIFTIFLIQAFDQGNEVAIGQEHCNCSYDRINASGVDWERSSTRSFSEPPPPPPLPPSSSVTRTSWTILCNLGRNCTWVGAKEAAATTLLQDDVTTRTILP